MEVRLPWDLTGCQNTLRGITGLRVSNSPHMPQSTRERLNAPHFHSQTQTEVTSALLAQGQPAAPSSPPATSHCHPPTNLFSCYNPTQNQVFKTTLFSSVLLKTCDKLSWDPRHLLGRSKGVKGDTRHTSIWELLEMPRGAFKSSSATQELVLPAREIKGC